MKEEKKCNDFKVYISSFFFLTRKCLILLWKFILWTWAWNCRDRIWILCHPTILLNIPKHFLAHFFHNMKEDPEEIYAHQPHDITHAFSQCFLHWAVSSAFPGCRYAESMFEHPWQGSVWQSPFSENSAAWAKTGSCSLVLLKNSLAITALLWIGCTVFSLFCTWAVEYNSAINALPKLI